MKKNIHTIAGIVLVLLLSTLIQAESVLAQNDPLVNLDPSIVSAETSEDKQVNMLFSKAESFYQKSLSSLDEADIYSSIETLEEVIKRYPDSFGAREAYLLIAELLSGKIQTREANYGAIMAYQDYLQRFSFMENAWRAQYSIASIQYLYLKDYESAKKAIEKLFDEFSASMSSNDDITIESTLLLAKIMHKNGKYEEETKAYQNIAFIDPKIDVKHNIELLSGIKPNRIKKDGIDTYIFMGEFDSSYPVNQVINRFKLAENRVKGKLKNLKREFPLEIFVYSKPDYFNKTTGRDGSFGSGADAQIFYLDSQPIEPLFAQVYAFMINRLPSSRRVAFLETGFINSFGDIDITLDTAALELGISDKHFKGETILDNGEFPFISENVAVSAAFVNYLLNEYPVEFFFRIFKMMEGSEQITVKLAGAAGGMFRVENTRVNPSTILQGMTSVYGSNFDTIAGKFLNEMTARRQELDRKLDIHWQTNPPDTVKIDHSSPESILIGYFKSIQTGKYDALRECTTGDLREVLDEAHSYYKKEGILDKVERWKMAIPYMDVKIEVVNRESFTDSVVVFEVNLLKNGLVMERKNLVALRDKNKWYISQN